MSELLCMIDAFDAWELGLVGIGRLPHAQNSTCCSCPSSLPHPQALPQLLSIADRPIRAIAASRRHLPLCCTVAVSVRGSCFLAIDLSIICPCPSVSCLLSYSDLLVYLLYLFSLFTIRKLSHRTFLNVAALLLLFVSAIVAHRSCHLRTVSLTRPCLPRSYLLRFSLIASPAPPCSPVTTVGNRSTSTARTNSHNKKTLVYFAAGAFLL